MPNTVCAVLVCGAWCSAVVGAWSGQLWGLVQDLTPGDGAVDGLALAYADEQRLTDADGNVQTLVLQMQVCMLWCLCVEGGVHYTVLGWVKHAVIVSVGGSSRRAELCCCHACACVLANPRQVFYAKSCYVSASEMTSSMLKYTLNVTGQMGDYTLQLYTSTGVGEISTNSSCSCALCSV